MPVHVDVLIVVGWVVLESKVEHNNVLLCAQGPTGVVVTVHFRDGIESDIVLLVAALLCCVEDEFVRCVAQQVGFVVLKFECPQEGGILAVHRLPIVSTRVVAVHSLCDIYPTRFVVAFTKLSGTDKTIVTIARQIHLLSS